MHILLVLLKMALKCGLLTLGSYDLGGEDENERSLQ